MCWKSELFSFLKYLCFFPPSVWVVGSDSSLFGEDRCFYGIVTLYELDCCCWRTVLSWVLHQHLLQLFKIWNVELCLMCLSCLLSDCTVLHLTVGTWASSNKCSASIQSKIKLFHCTVFTSYTRCHQGGGRYFKRAQHSQINWKCYVVVKVHLNVLSRLMDFQLTYISQKVDLHTLLTASTSLFGDVLLK
jgi:hypothetical protein